MAPNWITARLSVCVFQVLWQRDWRVESYFTRDPRAADQPECNRPWRSAAAAKRSWRISKWTWIFYQYRAGISEPVESLSSDDRSQRAPDGSTSLDLSSGGRPNVRGQSQPSLVVLESLKLGFGHLSTARQRLSKSDIHGQRGAAPAMAAKVGGPRGFDSRAVVPVYMIAGAWVRV